MSQESFEMEFSQTGITCVVPTDLVVFLPYVVQQLNLPFVVAVQRRQQAEYVPKSIVARRMSRRPAQLASSDEHSKASEDQEVMGFDDLTFTVTTVVDATGRVVELGLERCAPPCVLMKVLQMALPHQPALERLSARRCRFTGPSFAELALLPLRCRLTDVCLDDSPVTTANYELLLDSDRVRRLSLARCSLDDAAAVRLAARLGIGGTAARSLRSLALTANRIGDVGARALATALRTNRALLHLDLAGNEIGDEGGRALLDVLHDFPLTAEEMGAKRRRRVLYVRRLVEMRAQCLARLEEVAARGEDARRQRGPAARVRLPERSLEARAAELALEVVGGDDDPYCAAETVQRHGRVHCRGNWALAYLNVAYNSVSAVSLARLRRALAQQAAPRGPGLLRVVVEGNELPAHSAHYAACDTLLEQAVSARTGKIKRSKT